MNIFVQISFLFRCYLFNNKKIRNNDLCRLRRECNLPDQAPTPVVLTRSAHGINFDTSFFDPTLNSGIKPIVLMCQENVKEVLSRKGAEVHEKMLFVFFKTLTVFDSMPSIIFNQISFVEKSFLLLFLLFHLLLSESTSYWF